jgi:hypothetical protein
MLLLSLTRLQDRGSACVLRMITCGTTSRIHQLIMLFAFGLLVRLLCRLGFGAAKARVRPASSGHTGITTQGTVIQHPVIITLTRGSTNNQYAHVVAAWFIFVIITLSRVQLRQFLPLRRGFSRSLSSLAQAALRIMQSLPWRPSSIPMGAFRLEWGRGLCQARNPYPAWKTVASLLWHSQQPIVQGPTCTV